MDENGNDEMMDPAKNDFIPDRDEMSPEDLENPHITGKPNDWRTQLASLPVDGKLEVGGMKIHKTASAFLVESEKGLMMPMDQAAFDALAKFFEKPQ